MKRERDYWRKFLEFRNRECEFNRIEQHEPIENETLR